MEYKAESNKQISKLIDTDSSRVVTRGKGVGRMKRVKEAKYVVMKRD